jgi:O-antigen ligase
VALVASFTALVVLVAAQAMARSRAGLGLTIAALFGALVLAVSDRRATSGVTPARLLLGATTLAAIFALQYALYRILERFTEDPLADARIAFARNTIAAAKAYMPFGSGMGTFVPVYAMFERPEDAMMDTFANRAHNDVVELWLEAGAAGLALMAIFLVWLGIAAVRLWRPAGYGVQAIDRSLARAATMIVGLIIAHSFVDYPLRTGAMMAILAFACALLIEPPVGPESEPAADAGEPSPMRGAAAPAPAQPAPGLAGRSPVGAGERWGADVNWPEEWRQNSRRGTERASGSAPAKGKPPEK